MANLVVEIDDSYDDELDTAFVALFANPEELTGRQLVKKHVSNYIKDQMNKYRESSAIETAKASVEKVDDLEVAEE